MRRSELSQLLASASLYSPWKARSSSSTFLHIELGRAFPEMGHAFRVFSLSRTFFML